MVTEKIAIRGLPRLAAFIFAAWGGLVCLKGLWDCFAGRPEAELYSARPWEFVTKEQWSRFAGFELAYGLACLGLAAAAWKYSERLPVFITREKKLEEF